MMEKSSASLPNFSLINSPSPINTSASLTGNIESHLSTANSQRRLRSTASHVSKEPSPGGQSREHTASNAFRLSSRLHSLFCTPSLPLSHETPSSSHLRSWPKPWMKWTAFVYGCFCVIYMSSHILAKLRWERPIPSTQGTSGSTSPLDGLSMQQRLSRISSINVPPEAFEPHVLRGRVTAGSSTTACLWAQEQDLDQLVTWSSRWRGPISILVTTSTHPSSRAREKFIGSLLALRNNQIMSSVSVHVLYLAVQPQASPNAYLNLARLFAQTSQVVLFPANISVPPPPTLSGSLLETTTHRVVILAAGVQTPFPTMAPLLLPRNHPTWCTERFFFSTSRVINWEQCVWQFWLDSFGEVPSVGISGQPLTDFRSHRAITTRIQRRLITKFRTESCDRADKKILALDSLGRKDGGKESQWLTKFCRENVT